VRWRKATLAEPEGLHPLPAGDPSADAFAGLARGVVLRPSPPGGCDPPCALPVHLSCLRLRDALVGMPVSVARFPNRPTRLLVRIEEGRDLIADDFGGTSDPYCVMRVRGVGASPRHFRTEVRKGTLAPQWGAEVSVDRGVGDGTLQFDVFDHDVVSRDDPLGSAALRLAGAELPLTTWLPLRLRGKDGDWDPAKGEIRVTVEVDGDGGVGRRREAPAHAVGTGMIKWFQYSNQEDGTEEVTEHGLGCPDAEVIGVCWDGSSGVTAIPRSWWDGAGRPCRLPQRGDKLLRAEPSPAGGIVATLIRGQSVYRAINRLPLEVFKQQSRSEMGESICWPAPTATTLEEEQTKCFLHPPPSIMLNVHGLTRGLEVEKVSAYPEEREILLAPCETVVLDNPIRDHGWMEQCLEMDLLIVGSEQDPTYEEFFEAIRQDLLKSNEELGTTL